MDTATPAPDAVLQQQISDAVRRVRSAPVSNDVPAVHDALGDAGRRALALVDERGVAHAVEEWVTAHNEYWRAAGELGALLADDELRQGRHQRVLDAGIRWRKQVGGQRRAALIAAARVAQRALDGWANRSPQNVSGSSG